MWARCSSPTVSAGLLASPTLLVGFLVGVGASTLALVMVLVVVATRRR